MRQLPFGEVPFAADAEHDLQVSAAVERAGRGGGHVVEELIGLVGAGRDPQGFDREGSVADPGVAVVPVAGAAHHLGQRSGGRRADRAGRREGERLEHPSAVVHQVSPRTHVGLVEVRPRLPRRHGVVQPGVDLGLAPDPGRARVGPRRVVKGEARALAAAELEPARDRRLIDGQGHRRRDDQYVIAGGRGQPTVDGVELGMDQSVLGPRDVLQAQLDFSFDARRTPKQKMRCTLAELMAAVAVAHRQRVDDDDRARRRAGGRLQHHGAVQVTASHLRRARGPDRPVAGCVTEQATEDRGTVEAGEAQPVDRSVPAHQCRAVSIRKERIVGDRSHAHVSS